MLPKKPLPGNECGIDVRQKPFLVRVRPKEIGAAIVSLPLAEYRAEVEDDEVAILKPPVGCLIVIGEDSMGP